MYLHHSLKLAKLLQVVFLAFAVAVCAADSNTTVSNGKNVPLRILPLGNSITFGFRSSDGNGFRKHLLDKIAANGTAQYIGSVRSGNMTDNHNEGHPGAVITEIGNFSRESLPLRPNLILLMAGTNDMNLNLSIGATGRLSNLIDMCSTACPDAVILVAQLTPAATPDVEARIEQFNPTVVTLASDREGKGMKIAAVDMPKFVKITDLTDNLHPNDVGYAKMADAWFEGIQQASAKGWFTPPVDGIAPPRGAEFASMGSTAGTSKSISPPASSGFHTTADSSTFTAFATPKNSSTSTSYFLPKSTSSLSTSLGFATPTFPANSSSLLLSPSTTNDSALFSGMGTSRLASLAIAVIWLLL